MARVTASTGYALSSVVTIYVASANGEVAALDRIHGRFVGKDLKRLSGGVGVYEGALFVGSNDGGIETGRRFR
jgi:hypothetical protein